MSVRGPKEALVAARGGAQIADVEFPASALGTPYPLNIAAVRKSLNQARFRRVRSQPTSESINLTARRPAKQHSAWQSPGPT